MVAESGSSCHQRQAPLTAPEVHGVRPLPHLHPTRHPTPPRLEIHHRRHRPERIVTRPVSDSRPQWRWRWRQAQGVVPSSSRSARDAWGGLRARRPMVRHFQEVGQQVRDTGRGGAAAAVGGCGIDGSAGCVAFRGVGAYGLGGGGGGLYCWLACHETSNGSSMTASAIPNSLLRVNGTNGEPPSAFERPIKEMDFFVLELGKHHDVESWCACATEAIHRHRDVLVGLCRVGATVTLFVECDSSLPVLRLEASFLTTLCDAGIALECCRDQNA